MYFCFYPTRYLCTGYISKQIAAKYAALCLFFFFFFFANPISTIFDHGGPWDGVKRSWLVVLQTGPEKASLKMPGSSLPWGCFNDISDGSPRATAGAGKYRVCFLEPVGLDSQEEFHAANEGRCSPPADETLSVKEGNTR